MYLLILVLVEFIIGAKTKLSAARIELLIVKDPVIL